MLERRGIETEDAETEDAETEDRRQESFARRIDSDARRATLQASQARTVAAVCDRRTLAPRPGKQEARFKRRIGVLIGPVSRGHALTSAATGGEIQESRFKTRGLRAAHWLRRSQSDATGFSFADERATRLFCLPNFPPRNSRRAPRPPRFVSAEPGHDPARSRPRGFPPGLFLTNDDPVNISGFRDRSLPPIPSIP